VNICVAGWYFHELLIGQLLGSKHLACFVSHRIPSGTDLHGLDFELIPNVGLEFGSYDWFLKNKCGSGPALFMHDDTEVLESALDLISQMTVDQAFLFSSEADAQANGKVHGRAIFCSEKFLARLKADGGFWYDERPCDGKEIPPTTADSPDYHNSAIQVFRAYLGSLPKDEFSVGHVAVVPGLKTGYRGRL
jgi:hypothetical protein